MPESAAPVKKRKNPPTFHHLPINRAATLKKAWVQKTKIKAKWKAQKRKEGLDQPSRLGISALDTENAEVTPEEDHNLSGNERESEAGSSQESRKSELKQNTKHQGPAVHPSRAHIHPTLPVRKDPTAKPSTDNSRPIKRQRTGKAEESAEPAPSLRELTKQAYSRETLHTYKAEPLKKHRSSNSGGPAVRGRAPATGRGQPNMKLRMNAMLAKIKQDYA